MHQNSRNGLVVLGFSLILGTLGACSTQDGPYMEDSEVAPYGDEGYAPTDTRNSADTTRNSAYSTRRPVSSNPKPWSSSTTSTAKTSYPVAKRVAGKSGRVYSPFAEHAGEVDVSGLNSGTQAKCPYTGNIFIVP